MRKFMSYFLASVALSIMLFSLPENSFSHTRYKCPKGYSFPNQSGVSIRPVKWCRKTIYTKAKFHKRTKCPKGTFFDLYRGGTCWSCPRGYPRSIHHVAGAKACAKYIGWFRYKHKRARYHGKKGCLRGTFFDLYRGGTCWSCPRSFSRGTQHITHAYACRKVLKAKPIPK